MFPSRLPPQWTLGVALAFRPRAALMLSCLILDEAAARQAGDAGQGIIRASGTGKWPRHAFLETVQDWRGQHRRCQLQKGAARTGWLALVSQSLHTTDGKMLAV